MTVGEALAEARTRAGLSVDEVSERTKIREVVIRAIELDDYEACGGDLFVRGYVRVIADAVGLEAQPLIREYDQSHQSGMAITPVPLAPGTAAPAPADPEPADEVPADQPPADEAPAGEPPADQSPVEQVPADQRPADEPPAEEEAAGPVPTVIDLTRAGAPDLPDASLKSPSSGGEPPVGEPPAGQPGAGHLSPAGQPEAGHLSAAPAPQAGYELVPLRIQPGPRLHPSLTQNSWRAWFRDRRRGLAATVLAITVLAVAAVAGEQVASRAGGGSGASAAANSGAAGQAHPPQLAAPNADPAGASAGKAKAAPHPKRAKTSPPAPVRQLAVPLAEAFGPHGAADGDNPGNAMNAVRAGAASPWTTHWYTSARFGQLKAGTGLLLDMGRTVTVTRVAVNLGAGAGADLEVRARRAGSAGSAGLDGIMPGGLRTKASATGAGGHVVLRLREPVRTRYVLLWFTALPTDGSGRYQASVYHVTVDGRP